MPAYPYGSAHEVTFPTWEQAQAIMGEAIEAWYAGPGKRKCRLCDDPTLPAHADRCTRYLGGRKKKSIPMALHLREVR